MDPGHAPRIDNGGPQAAVIMKVVNVSARDLARLQATGADVEPLRGALDDGADALDVRIETTLGASVRMGHVVAEARSLAAHIADGCHGDHS